MSTFQDGLKKLNRLPTWLHQQVFAKRAVLDASEDPASALTKQEVVENPADANLITARKVGAWSAHTYKLLLDLDGQHHYVPSSTPGHGHLYIDAYLTKEGHDEILSVLAKYGIVQFGFADAALKSEYGATLRPPWVYKDRAYGPAPVEPF